MYELILLNPFQRKNINGTIAWEWKQGKINNTLLYVKKITSRHKTTLMY